MSCGEDVKVLLVIMIDRAVWKMQLFSLGWIILLLLHDCTIVEQ